MCPLQSNPSDLCACPCPEQADLLILVDEVTRDMGSSCLLTVSSPFLNLPAETEVPPGLKGGGTTYLAWGNPADVCLMNEAAVRRAPVSKRQSGQDFSLLLPGDLHFSHFLLCLPLPDQTKP